jgi:acyl-coenzyme A thioesterase PaaI-like protein
MDDEASLRAQGWSPIEVEGFCRHISPMWTRGEHGARDVGLLIEPGHANVYQETLYGGALMAFADAALSFGVGDAVGGVHFVTAQLQTHFTAAARVGEFLQCRPEVIRRTRDLIFVRGLFTVEGKVIAHADGIWKVLDPERRQALTPGARGPSKAQDITGEG